MNAKNLVMVVCAATALSGCKPILSNVLEGPDEMAVVDAAPLTLPPNFELRPPRPNEEVDEDAAAVSAQAEALITGAPVADVAASDVVRDDTPAAPSDDAWLFDKIGAPAESVANDEKTVQDVPEKGFFQRTFSKE